jgi:dUTPase
MSIETEFSSFANRLFHDTQHTKLMRLSIFVDSDDEELKKMYVEAINAHNQKIMNDPHYYDAGFDLYLPKQDETSDKFISFYSNKCNKVDFKVKCCAEIYSNLETGIFTPFYTYARSSISKTPLRLANNQGIIDAGYRGNLIGMFDCISNEGIELIWNMEKYSRILQICAPSLIPIYVEMVDTFGDLGAPTSRGDGGFGSTGK